MMVYSPLNDEIRPYTKTLGRLLQMGRGSNANLSEDPTHLPTFIQTHPLTALSK